MTIPQQNASDSSSANRRSVRSVVINWPMQREFTLITIAIMMFSAGLVSFVIHSTLRETILTNLGRVGQIGAYNILSDVSFELIFRVILVFFFTVIGVGVAGIFFLHRIAGPAYRFHQLFRRLAKNEIPQDILLREKDFFQEIALELNHVFRSLRKRKAAIAEIESILSSISEKDASLETRERIQEIRSILRSTDSVI